MNTIINSHGVSLLHVNSIAMIAILYTCIHQVYEKSILKALQTTCHVVIVTTSFLLVCVILLRILLFLKELLQINTNYDGYLMPVMKATLNFNTPSWIIISITLFSFMMSVFNSNYAIVQVLQINTWATLLAMAFSVFLFTTADIMECRAHTIGTIFSSGGLDPGSAMAGSYFYGYLKIMLPASGGIERPGMLKVLETYENNENITIPAKKLFILIPSSSYIPPDLREISNNWLQPAKSLETVSLDRAGVKSRKYHNTVYKLYPKGNMDIKPIYVAVEGATPLKTFLEVQDKSHKYALAYKEFNREIVKNFYITLQNHLNENPDCRDYCELVYYEDNLDGKRMNPADVLLERINHLMHQD